MQRTRRITRITAAGALALCGPALLVACSDDKKSTNAAEESSTTTAPAAPVNQGATIEVTEFSYTPSNQTVAVGETVTWSNVGSAPHTVTPDVAEGVTPPFQSQQVRPDDNPFVATFNTPGDYPYYCSIHGREVMSGSITVVEEE